MSEPADLSLARFEPGTYLLSTDAMSGIRKMGLVQENGLSYIDLTGSEHWGGPWPIYAACAPQGIGNIKDWMQQAHDQDCHEAFCTLMQRLLSQKVDLLSLSRTLYWALQEKCFEYELALKAGFAQTEAVITSRVCCDQLIERSGILASPSDSPSKPTL